MKLELTRGCKSFGLYKDDEDIHQMKEVEIKDLFNKTIDHLYENKGVSYDDLLESLIETYGFWEFGKETCECCGDTIDSCKLEI